jgi:DNA-binding response OmpR family regulator
VPRARRPPAGDGGPSLLARLAGQPEVAHSREELMSEVWDEHRFGSTNTLDVNVAALRRKVREHAAADDRVPRIVTVRGHGFRLDSAPELGTGRQAADHESARTS